MSSLRCCTSSVPCPACRRRAELLRRWREQWDGKAPSYFDALKSLNDYARWMRRQLGDESIVRFGELFGAERDRSIS